jgi:hypothetical protein
MKSVTSTSPSAVVQRVTRTSVSPSYLRVAVARGSAGASSQRPWSTEPRSAPNTDGES